MKKIYSTCMKKIIPLFCVLLLTGVSITPAMFSSTTQKQTSVDVVQLIQNKFENSKLNKILQIKHDLKSTRGDTPYFVTMDLVSSSDQTNWDVMLGDINNGYRLGMDDSIPFYYLNASSATTNVPLAEDDFGFYVDTYPTGFFAYWDARGVNAGASPGTWQEHMWQIINGNEPIFYVSVGTGQTFRLLDGLLRDFAGSPDALLRISGDYFLGDYTYNGTVTSAIGDVSDMIYVEMTFVDSDTLPDFLSLDLVTSEDQTSWSSVSGNYSEGYTLTLDDAVQYHYLNISAALPNVLLKEDDFGFYVDTYPTGFFAYWDARGVNAGASPGTWQEHMWQIINGNEPIFYVSVGTGQTFRLLDGLLRDFAGSPDALLRINGDYFLGDYTYNGTIESTFGITSNMLYVDMTFEDDNVAPFVPSSPSPVNHATGVSILVDLGWVGGDPDAGDTVTYDVYFGTSVSPPKVSGNQSGLVYDPGSLSYDETYYWRIVSWDNHGAKTGGPIWDFVTESEPNNPPDTPHSPNPSNGQTNVNTSYTQLIWSGDDPDPGDTVTYDVYFGDSSPPPKIVSNQTVNIYFDGSDLDYETTYYWKIVSWDNHGAKAEGPQWQFTTESDTTPPSVEITKPRFGALYFFDVMLFFFFPTTFIIGRITIEADATDDDSGINRVEFYVEGQYRFTDYQAPYQWTWDDPIGLFTREITVRAVDNAGIEATDSIEVWKFL